MRKLAALAAAMAFLVAASDARAASVDVFGFDLFYIGDDTRANLVTIELDGTVYRITDRGTDELTTIDPACAQDPADDQVVECAAAGVTSIDALGFGGNDQVTVDSDLPARLEGGAGADTLTGGSANDELEGNEGIDTLVGRAGDDVIVDSAFLDQGDRLEGGPGTDVLGGGFGADTLLGGPGNDTTLIGGPGDDVVDGGEGDDVLDGGDALSDTGGADRLIGGPGVDQLDYGFRSVGLVVSLGDGPNDGVAGEGDDASGDIEILLGGQGVDTLTGGPGPETIVGNGGDDLIDGGGGNDVLDGGNDGAGDTLRGGAGDDALYGRAGEDRLEGGDGGDTLHGDTGGDALSGGEGADRLLGESGDDQLEGDAGGDELIGGEGTDTVRYPDRGTLVQVTIDGVANDGEVAVDSDGHTRIEEGAQSAEGDNVDVTTERVTTTRSDDTLAGDNRPNAFDGSSGEDFLDGGGGADTLDGGASSDGILSRDDARDRVTCGPGYDYVIADSRDLVDARAACEYVDDGSRSAPRARKDVAVRPRCAARRDAEVSPPGTTRGMPIDQRVLVPVGSAVDALDCPVTVIAADGRGHARAGTLRGGSGMMRITQVRRPGGRMLTRLRAADCASRAAIASGRVEAVASRFRKPQYRRRYGRIAFPAEVRVDAAVMTKRSGVATWTVDDRCGRSATISVTTGRLVVLDLGTDRRVVLGPGDSHRATAP